MTLRATLTFVAIALVAGCSDNGRVLQPATESFVSSSTELPCSGNRSALPEKFTVYFDAVALPTSDRYPTALQTGAQGQYSHDKASRLFAKTGLYFKPGRAFEITVPESLRDRMSIGWGQRSWQVTIPDCGDMPSEWQALPGGYWLADPLCAELIVSSGADEQRVEIGLGTSCPGQAPPLEPSDE